MPRYLGLHSIGYRILAELGYRLFVFLNRSELSPNWNAPGNKVWNFSYADEEQQMNVSLAVDARTGEFLRYSVYWMQDKMDYFKTPEVQYCSSND